MLSLNVRGIRSFDKRKSLFHWLVNGKCDFFFFYKKLIALFGVENIWKSQWRGDIFFSHGSEHSKGVMILFKEKFDYEIKIKRVDEQGRFITLKSVIQGQPIALPGQYLCAE